VPQSVGATRSEGGRSPGKRGCFSEGQERTVCALQKAKPAIREGIRNPVGLELLSVAAERGNYPEAKPNRDGLKADLLANTAALSSSFDTTLVPFTCLVMDRERITKHPRPDSRMTATNLEETSKHCRPIPRQRRNGLCLIRI
jgi:hypothetical protein